MKVHTIQFLSGTWEAVVPCSGCGRTTYGVKGRGSTEDEAVRAVLDKLVGEKT